MYRPLWVAIAATISIIALSGATARADDPYRLVLSRIDPTDFPTVRFVASAVDASGRAVAGLRPQDLEVREGAAHQDSRVTLASMVSPVALALVVDTSGSMAGRPLADAKAAMAVMIAALGASDQVAVLSFNTAVRVAQPLTSDKAAALAALDTLVAGGNTAIYDAALAGADTLNGAAPKARAAIVLLTDGVDNSSRSSRQATLPALAAKGYPIYAIGLGNDLDRSTLDALGAAVPGGTTSIAPSSAQLARIYAGLSEQLLTEYSVEYVSAATANPVGSTVTFEARLAREGAIVAHTTGTFVIPAGRGTVTQRGAAVREPSAPALPVPVPPVRSRNGWIVGLLGAMTALMFVLWLHEITLLIGAGPRRRIRALISGTSEAETTERRALLARLGGPLHAIGRVMLRWLPAKYLEQTRQRLEIAGEPLGVVEFVGLRCSSTLALCFAVGVGALVVSRAPEIGLFGAAIGAAFGYALPALAIGAMSRSRRKAIQRALIPSLDMLALSAEAGLAFDGAITQVVQRWKNPLSDELRRLLLEFQMGRERRQALRELARRTDVADIAKFVNAVIQADSLGVGLAKVLQDQAVELRTKRRQRAEEQARVAPVKMMFPMVLLIFPALFVVILGPAVPKMTAMFNLH